MNAYASRTAITRASDADHAAQHPRMRAHLYITREGITYRSN